MNVMGMWDKCQKMPLLGSVFGQKIFSKALGLHIPYTGSVGAEVIELEPGRSRVKLSDRRRVRNHLKSIHAVALMNVGELSTGLALGAALPPGYRFILKNFEISYLKKARHVIFALGHVDLPSELQPSQDIVVTSRIESSEGELLCEVKALWRVSVQGDSSQTNSKKQTGAQSRE